MTAPAASLPTPISVPFTFDNHTLESNRIAGIDSAPGKRFADGAASAEVGDATNNDARTILRIKRKRHEEPLDTLVVQAQLEKLAGKKVRTQEDKEKQEQENEKAGDVSLPKPPPAVFRLATTLNTKSFKDPTQTKQLRDRINQLAETTRRPRSRIGERYPDAEAQMQTPAEKSRAELTERRQRDAQSARYRVINQNRTGLAPLEQMPPRVISSAEAQAEAALDMFKMYDAVKEELPKTKAQIVKEQEEDDIMCNFLPMVKEYLQISDKTADPKITMGEGSDEHGSRSMASGARRTGDDNVEAGEDSEDEYVYDIYYQDLHADHQQESMKHRAVGSLLWFSDDENNFLNEDDSSDDDYEDSDSNAEDYYQNDYPEDELSDNEYAYEHEHSESDDDDYMY